MDLLTSVCVEENMLSTCPAALFDSCGRYISLAKAIHAGIDMNPPMSIHFINIYK